MANVQLDIAIIGGGVSGVYSGWKLKEKYGDKKRSPCLKAPVILAVAYSR
ncbi:hypothetical protein [Paraflavitalea speifideaquila]|nr:hypothetical protein [Paraflavitalea speifideiaquila]